MPPHDPLATASLGSTWILHASSAVALDRCLALPGAHGARARPLVGSVDPAVLRALEAEAALTPFAPLRSLVDYVGVDARALAPSARVRLTRAILAQGDVELVEVAPDGLSDPPWAGTGSAPVGPRRPGSRSFRPSEPAPLGLGVRHAHGERGCRGAGVRVAVVERGWDLTSPLLPTARIRLLCNDVLGHRPHGGGVLAVLCAAPDAADRGGVAPEVDEVLLAGEGVRAWAGLDLAADAIVAATVALRPGDVLLLEAQREEAGRGSPAEVSAPILHALRLATARGVVVVEAAGNGGGDLDACTSSDGRSLDPGAATFVDSGAVLVGACAGPPRWSALRGATHGRRLDVVAPGDGVAIPGGSLVRDGGGAGGGAEPVLTGTSAAAALVAGCVVLLQSARRATGASPWSPLEVRERLRDARRGTRVAGFARRCPDLARLLAP